MIGYKSLLFIASIALKVVLKVLTVIVILLSFSISFEVLLHSFHVHLFCGRN